MSVIKHGRSMLKRRVSQGLRSSRLHYNQTSSPVLFSSSIQRKVKPFHWKIRLKPQSMYTCILAVRNSKTIFCDHAGLCVFYNMGKLLKWNSLSIHCFQENINHIDSVRKDWGNEECSFLSIVICYSNSWNCRFSRWMYMWLRLFFSLGHIHLKRYVYKGS